MKVLMLDEVVFGLILSFPDVSLLGRLGFAAIGMGAVRGMAMGVDMAVWVRARPSTGRFVLRK